MEIRTPWVIDDNIKCARVKSRSVGVEVKPILKFKPNPILNFRLYVVEFISGTTENLAENVIVKNILAQVNYKIRRKIIIDEIAYHCCDQTKALKKWLRYITKWKNA